MSTASAALYNGLEPVFVDVDQETLGINLEDLQKKLSEKVDKNDLKQYDSAMGKLKDKQSEDTKRIKQLKEDIISVKKELKNIKAKQEKHVSKDKKVQIRKSLSR